MYADRIADAIGRLPRVLGCLVCLALLAITLLIGTLFEVALRTLFVSYVVALVVWWTVIIPVRIITAKLARRSYKVFDLFDGIAVALLAIIVAVCVLWGDMASAVH